MTKRDLMRLLADIPLDCEIEFDAGGCSSWHHRIGCVVMASIDGGAPVVLLAEDEDGEEYADAKRLETRRRFTDFEIILVQWIDRTGEDQNGTIAVLPRGLIDQPECDD